jgi:hypothetical protein
MRENVPALLITNYPALTKGNFWCRICPQNGSQKKYPDFNNHKNSSPHSQKPAKAMDRQPVTLCPQFVSEPYKRYFNIPFPPT